jgi:tetratricopeptide (TPR) repeat protein
MIYPQKQNLVRLLTLLSLLLLVIGSYGCSGNNPEELFQQGEDAVEAGNLDEAVIWFKKALQEDPEMAMAHFKLGQVYRQKGDTRQAYGQLSHAVQQDPTLKDARKELVFVLVESRALKQAVEVCRKYLEVNGDDEDIYLILGNSLAYTKKLDEAIVVMNEAISKYPDSTAVKVNLAKMMVAGGKVAEGRALLEKVVEANPEDIHIQMALVQVYQKIERFDLAVMSLEQMKKRFPESPLPYLALAQLALQKSQPDQAKEILLEAQNAGIIDSGIYRLYAMITHRQGDSETALEYFIKAVDAAPEEQLQLNQMILVDYHSYLKNYKEAQEILETIIAADETKKNLQSKVVELFLAQGEFEQARASVDALLQENAGDARGHFLKGLMMMQEKEVVGAREQFSKAKELAPDAAENQFLYGLTFMNESQDISITEISEALKKNPGLVKARMALAELFAKKGDYQASLDELNKVIEKRPTDYKVRALRISLLLKLNRPGDALEDAKLLVEKEPEISWHVFRLAEIYFFIKEYDTALPLYERLWEEKAESVQVLNRVVGIYMLKKDQEKAMDVVDSFLVKYPDNTEAIIVKAKVYISQGYLDLAENVLLPVANKGEDVAIINMIAELYKTKKNTAKATEYYKKALALAPENIGIMMKIADLHLSLGETPEAIKYYEMILKEKDDFLPAMNNLAYLYGEDGENLERALELAISVSRKLPDNPDVADTLGWIHVMNKDYSLAEQFLQKAVDAKPDTPAIVYHMGVLRFHQKKQQDAEQLFNDAVGKGLAGKELAKAKEMLAEIEGFNKQLLVAVSAKEQGDSTKAIRLFEEILEREGFNGVAAAELAMLYAEQNRDITKALELSREAYDAKPTDAHRADALGWVYYHQGSLLMAKKYVEEAIANDESYGAAQLHLGAVYLKKEDATAAKRAFEKASSMTLSAADKKQLEALMQAL